jgi:ActR/RegA family two-component response regulator
VNPGPIPTAAIYDDDAGNRRALCAMVSRCGFEITSSGHSAHEAMIRLGVLAPDLVIFELALAVSRGLGVVADLRAVAPRCDVILLADFEELRGAALAAGAYELVGKCDLRDLERSLRRWVSAGTAMERRPAPASSSYSEESVTSSFQGTVR